LKTERVIALIGLLRLQTQYFDLLSLQHSKNKSWAWQYIEKKKYGTCICPMHAVSNLIIQTRVCHVERLLLSSSSHLSPF